MYNFFLHHANIFFELNITDYNFSHLIVHNNNHMDTCIRSCYNFVFYFNSQGKMEHFN